MTALRLACAFLIACIPLQTLHAETPNTAARHGLVLLAPEGRWAVRVEWRNNGYWDHYGSDGQRQAVGAAFDGLDLNATVFPALAALGPGASLGRSRFSARVAARRMELTLGYGLRDDLTLGLILPWGEVRTYADLRVEGGNVGFNPAYDPARPPGDDNPPLLPVGAGATEPVGTDGVQRILSDPAFGFAYRPLGESHWQGIGDPTFGVLWRAYAAAGNTLVLGTGIQLGLAQDVDPDDLLQLPISDGSTDFRLRGEYYRELGRGFDLRTVADYTHQTPDHVTRRIPPPGQTLAPADSKRRLERRLGAYWEFDLGLGKRLGDWRLSLGYHRYQKGADRYRDPSSGTEVSSLSANTEVYADQWRAAVSWSGIGAWQRGHLPVPLIVQLETQQTWRAKNFPDVSDVYLQLTSFF